jgi:hypothetical protein
MESDQITLSGRPLVIKNAVLTFYGQHLMTFFFYYLIGIVK